jgi:hypothetical protein
LTSFRLKAAFGETAPRPRLGELRQPLLEPVVFFLLSSDMSLASATKTSILPVTSAGLEKQICVPSRRVR